MPCKVTGLGSPRFLGWLGKGRFGGRSGCLESGRGWTVGPIRIGLRSTEPLLTSELPRPSPVRQMV